MGGGQPCPADKAACRAAPNAAASFCRQEPLASAGRRRSSIRYDGALIPVSSSTRALSSLLVGSFSQAPNAASWARMRSRQPLVSSSDVTSVWLGGRLDGAEVGRMLRGHSAAAFPARRGPAALRSLPSWPRQLIWNVPM